jgi:hypothetical protein
VSTVTVADAHEIIRRPYIIDYIFNG